MSTPALFWYPEAGGPLQILDFGEGLQDLQESPAAEVTDAVSGDGFPFRFHQATTLRVRVLLERFGAPGVSALERKIQTFTSHVFRGGLFGFAEDVDKAWAALCSTAPAQGDTTIEVGAGTGFAGWGTAALEAGDEMVIESAWPDSRFEISTLDGLSFGLPVEVTLETALVYTYTGATLVRPRHFYPVCWAPKESVSRPLVTSDHRRNYTLDFTFEYSLAAALSLWDAGDPDLRGTSGLGDSLQELVRGGA